MMGGILVHSSSKLDNQSRECTFLGYSGLNYHVLDQQGCVFVSQDVIFEEGNAHLTLNEWENDTEAAKVPSNVDTLIAPANEESTTTADPPSTNSTPASTEPHRSA